MENDSKRNQQIFKSSVHFHLCDVRQCTLMTPTGMWKRRTEKVGAILETAEGEKKRKKGKSRIDVYKNKYFFTKRTIQIHAGNWKYKSRYSK